ncbi:hypothetical protein SDC9_129050 [bioreactor metagenome]|uniref:Uncharacterized protein n=1 Tax=bioreactor metagenome TaxID=1076179 RepID=A0A645CZJ3_9ZZZZ
MVAQSAGRRPLSLAGQRHPVGQYDFPGSPLGSPHLAEVLGDQLIIINLMLDVLQKPLGIIVGGTEKRDEPPLGVQGAP